MVQKNGLIHLYRDNNICAYTNDDKIVSVGSFVVPLKEIVGLEMV